MSRLICVSGYRSSSLENAYNKHHNDINNNRQFDNRNSGPGQFHQRSMNFNPGSGQLNQRQNNFNQGQNNFNQGPKFNQGPSILNTRPNNVMGELRVLADNLSRNVGSIGNGMNNNGNFGNPSRNIMNNCVMMGPNQGQFWETDFVGEQYVEEQQENINRYGGPIHRPTWGISMSTQQINQVTNVPFSL